MIVEWTEPALSDLEGIRDFIATDSPHYAQLFCDKITAAVEKLEDFPEIGRSVPEAQRDDVRELIFQSYRIVYQITSERVLILAVVHGRRDLFGRSSDPWDIS